jgi:hypothetical protein
MMKQVAFSLRLTSANAPEAELRTQLRQVRFGPQAEIPINSAAPSNWSAVYHHSITSPARNRIEVGNPCYLNKALLFIPDFASLIRAANFLTAPAAAVITAKGMEPAVR